MIFFLLLVVPFHWLDHWRVCEGIAAVQQLYQLWSGCVCDAIVLHISPIAVLRGRCLVSRDLEPVELASERVVVMVCVCVLCNCVQWESCYIENHVLH